MPVRHARAVDLAAGGVVVERHGTPPGGGSRAALVAHHADDPRVSRSVRTLVAELDAAGYRVVLVSSSTFADPLDWGGPVPDGLTVVRKPNVGYDFGSWAVGLDLYPDVADLADVVLTNDSLLGPFASLQPLLERFHASPADVWGLTETLQFTRHVQSYFLGFRRGVLREPPLAHFWADVRHYDDKQLVIHRNELGFATLLQREGYTVDAAFVAATVVDPADNPTIAGWRTLLERGFPFVKREIARSPGLAPAGDTIPAAVQELYGTDLGDWGRP